MQYRIVMKGTNQVYRIPEDMFDFAAQNLINVGRAEKIIEEPTLLDRSIEVAASMARGARQAARFAYPFSTYKNLSVPKR